jgi:hypothetical protein
MQTSHSPTVQQTREMRKTLQRTILLAIHDFENFSGCHVEGIELTRALVTGRSGRTHSVECRVVL